MSFEVKPEAAFVFSLIGGMIGLFVSLFLLAINSYLSIWIGFCSLLVVIGAVMMYWYPEDAMMLGITVLALSIIGLGSIFGIVGGILAVVWEPNSARVCPRCGQVLAREAKFCTYCGNESVPPPSFKFQGKRFCPQCGSPIPQQVSYCPSCGKNLW